MSLNNFIIQIVQNRKKSVINYEKFLFNCLLLSYKFFYQLLRPFFEERGLAEKGEPQQYENSIQILNAYYSIEKQIFFAYF